MATDYISREAAVEAVRYYKVSGGTNFLYDEAYNDGIDTAISCIGNEVPPADVPPVVHGRWIPMTYIRELTENGQPNCRWEKAIKPDDVDGLMCSECGEIFDFADARNFCPNCGTDMRGEKNV